MNEAETRAELIDPALRAAGRGVVEGSRMRREHITLGRLQGGGKRAEPNAWRDRFSAVPFEDVGGTRDARYYQDIAAMAGSRYPRSDDPRCISQSRPGIDERLRDRPR
jgi:hypothetical protein